MIYYDLAELSKEVETIHDEIQKSLKLGKFHLRPSADIFNASIFKIPKF